MSRTPYGITDAVEEAKTEKVFNEPPPPDKEKYYGVSPGIIRSQLKNLLEMESGARPKELRRLILLYEAIAKEDS